MCFVQVIGGKTRRTVNDAGWRDRMRHCCSVFITFTVRNVQQGAYKLNKLDSLAIHGLSF